MTTTKQFHIWEGDVSCGTWDATDAVTALQKALADAAWDEHHEGRTIALTAHGVDDDTAAWAEVTVQGGRAVKVTVEAA